MRLLLGKKVDITPVVIALCFGIALLVMSACSPAGKARYEKAKPVVTAVAGKLLRSAAEAYIGGQFDQMLADHGIAIPPGYRSVPAPNGLDDSGRGTIPNVREYQFDGFRVRVWAGGPDDGKSFAIIDGETGD